MSRTNYKLVSREKESGIRILYKHGKIKLGGVAKIAAVFTFENIDSIRQTSIKQELCYLQNRSSLSFIRKTLPGKGSWKIHISPEAVSHQQNHSLSSIPGRPKQNFSLTMG